MPFSMNLLEAPQAIMDIAERGHAIVKELGGPLLGAVVLPEDETAHTDPYEWWYFKGHLRTHDERARHYSFLAVALRQRVLGVDVTVGIYKRIDHARGQRLSPHFVRLQTLDDTYEGSVDPVRIALRYGRDRKGIGDGLAWSVTSVARGLADGYHLVAEGDYGMDLQLTETAPAVLLGERGIMDYGADDRLAYYVRPHLSVVGEMPIDGRRTPVVGSAWVERQWGAAEVKRLTWKFIPVVLDDGARWTFFRVRHPKMETDMLYGARLGAGKAYEVAPESLAVIDDTARPFKPPLSSTTYFTHTCIRAFGVKPGEPDINLKVSPVFEDQLVTTVIPGVPTFWEGACTVEGKIDGKPVRGHAMTEISQPRT